MDDDAPLTLQEACDLIFRGNISPATLRSEARRGRLVIERIGNKDFVTPTAIKEMRKLCEITGTRPLQNKQPEMADAQRLEVARQAVKLTAERLMREHRKKK